MFLIAQDSLFLMQIFLLKSPCIYSSHTMIIADNVCYNSVKSNLLDILHVHDLLFHFYVLGLNL